jgi:hypothetical protein
MTERELERARNRPANPESNDAGGGGLDAARTRVDRLLRTADEAIGRALSRDSERFLEATRQAGGQ